MNTPTAPTLTLVQPELPPRRTPRGCVPALGALRRLRALAAVGWPAKPIARVAKVSPQTISRIRRGHHDYVQRAIDTAIAEAYDALSSRRPEQTLPDVSSARQDIAFIRTTAANAGWCHTPDDWGGLDMDDPAVDPTTGLLPTRDRARRALTCTAEDVLYLIDARTCTAENESIAAAWQRVVRGERYLVVGALSDPDRPGGVWPLRAISEVLGITESVVSRYRQQARAALAEAS